MTWTCWCKNKVPDSIWFCGQCGQGWDDYVEPAKPKQRQKGRQAREKSKGKGPELKAPPVAPTKSETKLPVPTFHLGSGTPGVETPASLAGTEPGQGIGVETTTSSTPTAPASSSTMTTMDLAAKLENMSAHGALDPDAVKQIAKHLRDIQIAEPTEKVPSIVTLSSRLQRQQNRLLKLTQQKTTLLQQWSDFKTEMEKYMGIKHQETKAKLEETRTEIAQVKLTVVSLQQQIQSHSLTAQRPESTEMEAPSLPPTRNSNSMVPPDLPTFDLAQIQEIADSGDEEEELDDKEDSPQGMETETGQNCKGAFQNSTAYRSGYPELQQTEKTETQDAKTASATFWRRPCPMSGVPGRDDHGRSRKVNFDTLPTYAFYDQVSDDEFGLWQEKEEETLFLMQELPKPRIVVKAWWSGQPLQAEPRRFIISTEAIEMEFLTNQFAAVWIDQIGTIDFAFQRLVMPAGSDTENAVHFLLYPTEVLPHSCPTLVAVHTDTPGAGSTTRWSPWCFKGHCLQGLQILRELGLSLSSTTRLVQNGRLSTPDSLVTLSRGNVLEIYEIMEETDIQALYQSFPTKIAQPLAASIGEPLRGDQLLGLDDAEETLTQTDDLPHVGDLHLYGFEALPEGMMQPRTVVLPDHSLQGHNFIMFALLDGMIRLPRRDAQISSWTDYNIRQMIFETWREFQPRDIDAYLVVPQPDRITRDGCVLVLHLRAPHVQIAPSQALVLCEFIITNRFRPDDFAESQHFACLLTTPGTSGAWVTSALSEEQFAGLEVANRVTMVQNRPIANHLRTFLEDGMLVTFLIDHRAPRPDCLEVFSLQQDFFLRIEDIFTGRPPRQGVTLIMHGHQGAYLGGRAISLFRPTLSDPGALLNSILAAWPERDATNLRVCGLRPGLRGFASDGSLEIHLLIIFGCSPNLRVGLVRRQANMDAWFTLELPHATTIGEIREACNVPDTFGLVNSGSISNPAHLELLCGFYLHLRETTTEYHHSAEESEEEEQSLLQKPPKPILLFDELSNLSDCPSTPATARPYQLWCKDTAAVLQQLDAHRILPLFAELHNFEWLEVSRSWTSTTWLLDQPCEELIFYTDGSAGRHHGGAGIVLFGRQGHRWHYGGYVGVHLAHCSNAHTAELAAMTVGLKWAIDEVKRNLFYGGPTPSICFRYDSTSAGKKILGEYGGDADGLLTSTGRNLHRILIQRFDAQVKGEHVFGHCGEPGNECANTVARWASEEGNAAMDSFITALINGHYAAPLDWAWLFWRADLAPFYKEGIFTFPQPELPEPATMPSSKTTIAEEDTKHVNFFFKVATANALTLKVTKQKEIDYGLQGISRLESLLQQCHEAEIHIIVFQESRLQRLYGQMNPFYHLHFAPATKQGHFGIVIGFSKQLPFAQIGVEEEEKSPLFFQNEKITIVDSNPRWLILHLRQPWLQCILVGFHGPHTQSSQEEAQQWWRDLHHAIPHRLRELPRLALGDANGHLGDIPSEAVQNYQSEIQDRNGELFHQYLLDNDLWIPSTFSQHQIGPGGTWRHWHGHLLRNDYVALPQTWKHLHVKTYVETKVDLALKREDHLVAACEIGGYGTYKFSSTCRKPDKFHLPSESHTKMELHRIAQLCPWIPWEVHPAEHDHILVENLTANMRTSIPRAKKRPYKPSISEDTNYKKSVVLKGELVFVKLLQHGDFDRMTSARRSPRLFNIDTTFISTFSNLAFWWVLPSRGMTMFSMRSWQRKAREQLLRKTTNAFGSLFGGNFPSTSRGERLVIPWLWLCWMINGCRISRPLRLAIPSPRKSWTKSTWRDFLIRRSAQFPERPCPLWIRLKKPYDWHNQGRLQGRMGYNQRCSLLRHPV